MKLSELIIKAQEYLATHEDKEVIFFDECGVCRAVGFVEYVDDDPFDEDNIDCIRIRHEDEVEFDESIGELEGCGE